jgi:FkbM family methyltransferase
MMHFQTMKKKAAKLLTLIPYLLRFGLGPMRCRRKLLENSKSSDRKCSSTTAYFSQNGQDEFLIEEVFKSKNEGFFVDIGANDGITFSNTYALEKKGWQGLCVEPHPDVFELLRRNRSCECICAAATGSSTLQSLEFWKISAERIQNCMLSGFPQFMNSLQTDRIQRLLESGDLKVEHVKVPTLNLGDRLSRVGGQAAAPDVICIDVEGAEWDILIDLLNKGVRPSAFCIENNELHYLLCYEMRKRGYSLKAIKGGDEIYALT